MRYFPVFFRRKIIIFTVFLFFVIFVWFLLPQFIYRFFLFSYPVQLLKNHYPIIKIQHDPDYKNISKKVIFSKIRPNNWVPLKELSKPLIGAVIVSEDWAFYTHSGYDANQIQEALMQSWKRGHLVRGASTISQQVIKNIFLSNEKSLKRKLIEIILAIQLEKNLSKGQILELYFNIVEFGPDLYGIKAAAQFYFSKTPAEINAKEGAFLAMLLPSPRKYNISFQKKELSAFAAQAIDSILIKMQQAGYLQEEERLALASQKLSFEKTTAPTPSSAAGQQEQLAEPEAEPEVEPPEPEPDIQYPDADTQREVL